MRNYHLGLWLHLQQASLQLILFEDLIMEPNKQLDRNHLLELSYLHKQTDQRSQRYLSNPYQWLGDLLIDLEL